MLDENKVDKIRNEVPLPDIYASLAEEASELAQAALKMYRLYSDTNPTNLTEIEAYRNLVEEYSDVLLVAKDILELAPDDSLMAYKLDRWCSRIDKRRTGSDFCKRQI